VDDKKSKKQKESEEPVAKGSLKSRGKKNIVTIVMVIVVEDEDKKHSNSLCEQDMLRLFNGS
jgi:hypothetical protein